METKYACDGCGECCRTYLVVASESDADREPRIRAVGERLEAPEGTPANRYRLIPRSEQGSCLFLGAGNRCSIYDTRPRTCRQFPAGSEMCQDVRRFAGLPMLLPYVGITVNGRDVGHGAVV